MDSAEEKAREIVADVGDPDRLKAMADLCEYSGYDEDGCREKYRLYVLARALLSSQSQLERTREALERAAEELTMAGVKTASSNSLLSLGLRQAGLRARAALTKEEK